MSWRAGSKGQGVGGGGGGRGRRGRGAHQLSVTVRNSENVAVAVPTSRRLLEGVLDTVASGESEGVAVGERGAVPETALVAERVVLIVPVGVRPRLRLGVAPAVSVREPGPENVAVALALPELEHRAVAERV